MHDCKVSVIIPTVQKNIKLLQQLINILDSDDAAEEIIVINNAIKPFVPVLNGYKIKIIVPESNLYVNQSWNYGISVAKNDIFLIINDDIICPKNLCSMILKSEILKNNKTGLIGIDTGYINNYSVKSFDDSFFEIDEFTQEDLKFSVQDKYLMLGNWGSAFFGKKQNYYQIPDIFKIIYGDNYLLFRNQLDNKINYKMSGLRFNHLHSLTYSSKEFCDVITQDCLAGQEYFK